MLEVRAKLASSILILDCDSFRDDLRLLSPITVECHREQAGVPTVSLSAFRLREKTRSGLRSGLRLKESIDSLRWRSSPCEKSLPGGCLQEDHDVRSVVSN